MNIMDWFSVKINKIGFEDVKIAIQNTNHIIINTLPVNEQDCLIKNTTNIEDEVKILNDLLENSQLKQKIILYGKNAIDETIEQKYYQLHKLGFQHVYVYYGGLFEWMLLQDIYGNAEFPTTKTVLDILKFRPIRKLY